MNSSLQCLLHIKPLESYFSTDKWSKDVNKSSPYKGVVAEAFAGLVNSIKAASSDSQQCVSPNEFQRHMSVLVPHLMNYRQQDCQEFLRFLLDSLSEDLNRKSLPPSPLVMSEGGGAPATPSPIAKPTVVDRKRADVSASRQREQNEPSAPLRSQHSHAPAPKLSRDTQLEVQVPSSSEKEPLSEPWSPSPPPRKSNAGESAQSPSNPHLTIPVI